MSVSDKKYWSQRVQELANSVKPVSDTDFFSSDAYREFTENAANGKEAQRPCQGQVS